MFNWFAKVMAMDTTQLLLVLFTGALVVVGILQWLTLRRSDDTLKATQRPWIEVDAKIDRPLEYSEKARTPITMPFYLYLKNSGHSPALNVRVLTKSLLVWDDEIAREIQHKLCRSLSAKGEGYGSTIFPNTPPVAEFEVMEIDKEEVEKYKAAKPKFTRPLIRGSQPTPPTGPGAC